MSSIECENALKMNEDVAEKNSTKPFHYEKKALFVSASKDNHDRYSQRIIAVIFFQHLGQD